MIHVRYRLQERRHHDAGILPLLPRRAHTALNRNIPGLRGYVAWEVTRRLMGDLETADAFVSQWYDDEEAMAVADASPEMAAAWKDVPN